MAIKIADFGLAQYANDEDQYLIKTRTKPLPIRSMSIEAIEHKVFSFQSDSVS